MTLRVTLTGAGGFVGRALANQFLEDGHEVTALAGPEDEIGTTFPAVGAVHRGDVRDPAVANAVTVGAAVVIHAAGPASVADSFANPAHFASVHVVGTAQMVAAACREQVAQFIYISSAEVYGPDAASPVVEDAPPRPVSPYGAAKLGAEEMARSLSATVQLPLTIVRPFCLYGGPHQRRNTLIGSLVYQVLTGGPVHLHDLSPIRDFLHVEDFARLVSLVIGDRRPGVSLNACSGEGVAIRDLALQAMAAAGSTAELVETGPTRPTDMDCVIGSRVKALREFGWEPAVPLAQGLGAMLV